MDTVHKKLETTLLNNERDITPATFQRYNYHGAHFGKGAQKVHVWSLFDQSNKPVRQKVRFLEEKDFTTLPLVDNAPSPQDCQLFGMNVWGDQHDKRVVVTEGEIDAMSVAQASDFKYPCVSINGGAASAAGCLKANYRWLDRFAEIILWFDDDAAGHEAVSHCAPLFASGKVKLAKVNGYKDANAALQDRKRGEIELAVYGASLWAPAGIVNAADASGLLMTDAEVPMWAYPFAGLQEMLGGLRRGEVVYLVAGTGIGKSSVVNECVDCWLADVDDHTEVPAHIGIMAFETLLRDTQLGILSVHANRRLHIDPIPVPEMMALHKEVFGARRVEMFDPETAEWGFDPLISYARYLVKALDCNILIIDPLSFVAAQLPDADERRALDKVAVTFAKVAKELGCAIIICHHLTRPEGAGHEEGARTSIKQLRGSGGMANFANAVVGFERNQQAEGSARLVTANRVLKNRYSGVTGVAGYTLYDEETGRTKEITPAEAQKLLGSDEPKANFGPASTTSDSEY